MFVVHLYQNELLLDGYLYKADQTELVQWLDGIFQKDINLRRHFSSLTFTWHATLALNFTNFLLDL